MICLRGQALAFVVILPGWEELSAWRVLSASAHLRARVVVAAADHGALAQTLVVAAGHQTLAEYVCWLLNRHLPVNCLCQSARGQVL